MEKIDKYHLFGLIAAIIAGISFGIFRDLRTGIDAAGFVYGGCLAYLLAARYRDENPEDYRDARRLFGFGTVAALVILCGVMVTAASAVSIEPVLDDTNKGFVITNGTAPYRVWVNGIAVNDGPAYATYYDLSNYRPGETVYISLIDAANYTLETTLSLPYDRPDLLCWVIVLVGLISMAVGLLYIPFGAVFGFLCGLLYLLRLFSLEVYSLPYALVGVVLSMLSLGVFIDYLTRGD